MALWGRSLGYRYDRTLGWLPVPDSHLTADTGRIISVVHNSRGFRDAEPSVDTRPGILFLGDSFVWGYNVQAEERFTDRLRTRHPEWQVYNCGICAYSTDQEYLLLQKHFEAYRPRIVFLIFCTENDEAGNSSNLCGQWYFKPYFTVGAKGLQLRATPVPGSERVFCVEHPLLCRSYLARLAVRAWGNLRSPPPPPGINPTTAILQALQAYVSSRGAVLYVGLTAGNPQLQGFLQHSNIPYVDLSTDLRYDSDVHWTSEGHAFVAEKIDAFLRSKSVLQTKRN